MSRMPRPFQVLVDLDGVLANFQQGIDQVVARHGGQPLGPSGWHTFAFAELYPDHVHHLRHAIRQPGFYAELLPIDGAIDGVRTLESSGFDTWVCTAPVRSRWCPGEKLDWVERHLGRRLASKTIITKDKTVVRGDVLIDDKPDIAGAAIPGWVHVLFDQPYNRDRDGHRIASWDDPQLHATILDAAERP